MRTEFENWIVDTVDTVGWAILSVSPRADSDDPDEWFSYSIGLPKTFDWPELICFGLDTDTRKHIINDAVEECRRKSIRPAPGMRLSDVLNGFDVLVTDGAGIPDHYFGSANWFAGQADTQKPVERLQLLWPDHNGFFPGDQRCADDVVVEQTPVERV